MEQQLHESMPWVELTELKRIQHRLLQKRYAGRLAELRAKCGAGGENVLRLWHGTGRTDPAEILSSEAGLDERMSSEKGFYGPGIYLAEHAWCGQNQAAAVAGVRVCDEAMW